MFSTRDILILNLIPRVGPRRLRAITDHFGDLGGISRAQPRSLSRVPGISIRLAESIHRFFRGATFGQAIREAEEQERLIRATGSRVLRLQDRDYPKLLSEIYDPPPLLFCMGEIPQEEFRGVAVVGTRHPSLYGKSVAEYFSRELSARGITVVSGMARGIDTVAHATALREGRKTIAVVGTGLDIIYPPENGRLCREISERGAILSEFLFGTGPEAGNFPRRNRIISGLCHGTIVVESDLNGGAMITARMALDQNREVFAVPGPARSARSRGCHALIRDGRAKLSDSVEDILSEFAGFLNFDTGVRAASQTSSRPAAVCRDEETESDLIDLLDPGPVHIDDLAGTTGAEIPDLLVRLLTLEMKNIVRQLPGKYFMKNG